MNVLGLSSDFHDASAALLRNGAIAFSAAEERFSLQKHDPGFPSLAATAALAAGGIGAGDVDWVAYHEDPAVKFSRVLASRLSDFPAGFPAFARSMRELVLGQLWVKLDVVKQLGVSPKRIRYVPHHLSHAAYAFATSPFESAAVLVLDAVGEWSSTTWFRARRHGGTFELQPLGAVPYPHSLGLLYSAFTGFLGYRVNDGECSLMALAAFGTPRYADRVRQVVRPQTDGTYEIDPGYFDFTDASRLPLSGKFYALFGPPRSFRAPLPFRCGMSAAELAAAAPEFRHFADVAASVQHVLEETVLHLAEKTLRESGEKNLCLAGGVALNAAMNGRLLRAAGAACLHVPPDPGDGGGALGAALYLQSQLGSAPSGQDFSPYLGASYAEAPAVALLENFKTEDGGRHRATSSELGAVRSLRVERHAPGDNAAIAESVCTDLRAGKVVGWLQGRFESGPRALGNRSLLCDPRNPAAARRLSRSIKARAAFRPYAVSVRAERQDSMFGLAPGAAPLALRWMGATQPVKETAREHLREALHVDGTTRPQILARDENPRYHRLLETWEAASGCPALLNTSFNESGYPMVSSPTEALLMFFRTDIETLVLNDAVVRKTF
jgi:carbamoyltransferase